MQNRPLAATFLALSVLAAACRQTGEDDGGDGPVADAAAPRSAPDAGRRLYGAHCAVCHGEDGAGDGVAAPYLFPPARDFGTGRFRLVSTTNGVPSQEDLMATLRRGMPGSAMPSWSWLTEAELAQLATHVRHLAEVGMGERLMRETDLTSAAATARAIERLTPGDPLPPVAPATPDAATLALGERVYAESCAGCHGDDGRGFPEPAWNEDGELNWARDFTAGFLKGGASHAALADRIRAGLPGSAMPPTRLADDELAALVAHVRSLIPEGSSKRLVQRRKRLRARRVSGSFLDEPGADSLWVMSDSIEVVLAPLWWRDESVLSATLSAIHDGDQIALRVRWRDATGETRLYSDAHRPDGVALQFTAADAPPLFGMGSAEHPTSIWHWRSLRLDEVAGALDLMDPTPHVLDRSPRSPATADVPVYRRVEGVPPVSRSVDELSARGVERARETPRLPADVDVHPRWRNGAWEVVFLRALEPADGSGTSFAVGSTLQVACAVWNGAAGDERAQKSISIWHELVIE